MDDEREGKDEPERAGLSAPEQSDPAARGGMGAEAVEGIRTRVSGGR